MRKASKMMYGLLVIDNGVTTFIDASENRQALKDLAKTLAESDVLQCQEVEDYVGIVDSLSLIYSARETDDGWNVVGTYRSSMEDKPNPWCRYKVVPALSRGNLDWSKYLDGVRNS